MENVYNKSDLLAHLDILKPLGYTLNNDLSYSKNIPEGQINITFNLTKYFPHSVSFGAVGVSFSFGGIEQILNLVWSTASNPGFFHDTDAATYSTSFGKGVLTESVFLQMRTHEVNDDGTFNIIRPNLESLIAAAVNFATQQGTLLNCYNYSQSLNNENRAYFLGQPGPARNMIAKKLLNTSDYNSFSNLVITNFTTTNPDPDKLAFYQALKTHLESI